MMIEQESDIESGLDEMFATDRDRGGDDAPPSDGGQPRDDHGRFAAKEDEPAPQPQAADGEQELEPPEPSEGEQPRHVPLSELQAERKKRQEFQARIEELERSNQDREAQYRAAVQAQQMQNLQQAPPPELPDIFEDPDAAINARLSPIQQQMQHQMEETRLNMSEDRARERYGDGAVDEAFRAAQQAGIIGHLVRERHPYGALVEWHNRERALSEIGNPEEYKTKLREEIMAELKGGGQQQPQQRFPGTLADQTRSNAGGGAAMTPQAAMDDIFDSDRRRR